MLNNAFTGICFFLDYMVCISLFFCNVNEFILLAFSNRSKHISKQPKQIFMCLFSKCCLLRLADKLSDTQDSHATCISEWCTFHAKVITLQCRGYSH